MERQIKTLRKTASEYAKKPPLQHGAGKAMTAREARKVSHGKEEKREPLWKRVLRQLIPAVGKPSPGRANIRVVDIGMLNEIEADSPDNINVLRKPAAEYHYGNPFVVAKEYDRRPDLYKKHGYERISDAKKASENYRLWLEKKALGGIHTKRRDWIIKQIEDGSLLGKTLLYFKDTGKEPNHARVLRDLVNKKRRHVMAEAGVATKDILNLKGEEITDVGKLPEKRYGLKFFNEIRQKLNTQTRFKKLSNFIGDPDISKTDQSSIMHSVAVAVMAGIKKTSIWKKLYATDKAKSMSESLRLVKDLRPYLTHKSTENLTALDINDSLGRLFRSLFSTKVAGKKTPTNPPLHEKIASMVRHPWRAATSPAVDDVFVDFFLDGPEERPTPDKPNGRGN